QPEHGPGCSVAKFSRTDSFTVPVNHTRQVAASAAARSFSNWKRSAFVSPKSINASSNARRNAASATRSCSGAITETGFDFERAEPNLIVEDRIAATECGPVIEHAMEAELGLRQFLQPPTAADVLICEPPVYDVGEVGKV